MIRTGAQAPEIATAPSPAEMEGNIVSVSPLLPSVPRSRALKRSKFMLATAKARHANDARLQATAAAIDALQSPSISSAMDGRAVPGASTGAPLQAVWVGSPSTNRELSFSASANRHINNVQAIPTLAQLHAKEVLVHGDDSIHVGDIGTPLAAAASVYSRPQTTPASITSMSSISSSAGMGIVPDASSCSSARRLRMQTRPSTSAASTATVSSSQCALMELNQARTHRDRASSGMDNAERASNVMTASLLASGSLVSGSGSTLQPQSRARSRGNGGTGSGGDSASESGSNTDSGDDSVVRHNDEVPMRSLSSITFTGSRVSHGSSQAVGVEERAQTSHDWAPSSSRVLSYSSAANRHIHNEQEWRVYNAAEDTRGCPLMMRPHMRRHLARVDRLEAESNASFRNRERREAEQSKLRQQELNDRIDDQRRETEHQRQQQKKKARKIAMDCQERFASLRAVESRGGTHSLRGGSVDFNALQVARPDKLDVEDRKARQLYFSGLNRRCSYSGMDDDITQDMNNDHVSATTDSNSKCTRLHVDRGKVMSNGIGRILTLYGIAGSRELTSYVIAIPAGHTVEVQVRPLHLHGRAVSHGSEWLDVKWQIDKPVTGTDMANWSMSVADKESVKAGAAHKAPLVSGDRDEAGAVGAEVTSMTLRKGPRKSTRKTLRAQTAAFQQTIPGSTQKVGYAEQCEFTGGTGSIPGKLDVEDCVGGLRVVWSNPEISMRPSTSSVAGDSVYAEVQKAADAVKDSSNLRSSTRKSMHESKRNSMGYGKRNSMRESKRNSIRKSMHDGKRNSIRKSRTAGARGSAHDGTREALEPGRHQLHFAVINRHIPTIEPLFELVVMLMPHQVYSKRQVTAQALDSTKASVELNDMKTFETEQKSLLSAVYAAIDKNHDGIVEPGEVLHFVQYLCPDVLTSKDVRLRLTRMFYQRGVGHVPRQDFLDGCRKLARGMPKAQFTALVQAYRNTEEARFDEIDDYRKKQLDEWVKDGDIAMYGINMMQREHDAVQRGATTMPVEEERDSQFTAPRAREAVRCYTMALQRLQFDVQRSSTRVQESNSKLPEESQIPGSSQLQALVRNQAFAVQMALCFKRSIACRRAADLRGALADADKCVALARQTGYDRGTLRELEKQKQRTEAARNFLDQNWSGKDSTTQTVDTSIMRQQPRTLAHQSSRRRTIGLYQQKLQRREITEARQLLAQEASWEHERDASIRTMSIIHGSAPLPSTLFDNQATLCMAVGEFERAATAFSEGLLRTDLDASKTDRLGAVGVPWFVSSNATAFLLLWIRRHRQRKMIAAAAAAAEAEAEARTEDAAAVAVVAAETPAQPKYLGARRASRSGNRSSFTALDNKVQHQQQIMFSALADLAKEQGREAVFGVENRSSFVQTSLLEGMDAIEEDGNNADADRAPVAGSAVKSAVAPALPMKPSSKLRRRQTRQSMPFPALNQGEQRAGARIRRKTLRRSIQFANRRTRINALSLADEHAARRRAAAALEAERRDLDAHSEATVRRLARQRTAMLNAHLSLRRGHRVALALAARKERVKISLASDALGMAGSTAEEADQRTRNSFVEDRFSQSVINAQRSSHYKTMKQLVFSRKYDHRSGSPSAVSASDSRMSWAPHDSNDQYWRDPDFGHGSGLLGGAFCGLFQNPARIPKGFEYLQVEDSAATAGDKPSDTARVAAPAAVVAAPVPMVAGHSRESWKDVVQAVRWCTPERFVQRPKEATWIYTAQGDGNLGHVQSVHADEQMLNRRTSLEDRVKVAVSHSLEQSRNTSLRALSHIAHGGIASGLFASAVKSLTELKTGVVCVAEIIDETYEDQGIYGVSLEVDAKWSMVYVDSFFPCTPPAPLVHGVAAHGLKESCCYGVGSALTALGSTPEKSFAVLGSPTHNAALRPTNAPADKWLPMFSRGAVAKSIWIQVVEKAFAKLYGSYEDAYSIRVCDVFAMLTGGIGEECALIDLVTSPEQQPLPETEAKQQKRHTVMLARHRVESESVAMRASARIPGHRRGQSGDVSDLKQRQAAELRRKQRDDISRAREAQARRGRAVEEATWAQITGVLGGSTVYSCTRETYTYCYSHLGAAHLAASSASGQAASEGIVPCHCYTILGTYERRPHSTIRGGIGAAKAGGHVRLLHLRNPWGQVEWNGPWSDGSSQWNANPLIRDDIATLTSDAVKECNDGEFWIALPDFVRRFAMLHWCRLFREVRHGGEWHRYMAYSEWNTTTAGGHPDGINPSEKNPHFVLRVAQPTRVVVVLTQVGCHTRAKAGVRSSNIAIGMKLLANGGRRCHTVYKKEERARTSWRDRRQVHFETTLQPHTETSFDLPSHAHGAHVESPSLRDRSAQPASKTANAQSHYPYTLVVSAWHEGQCGSFAVTVYTDTALVQPTALRAKPKEGSLSKAALPSGTSNSPLRGVDTPAQLLPNGAMQLEFLSEKANIRR